MYIHVHVGECTCVCASPVCCAQICQKTIGKDEGYAVGTLSTNNTWYINSLDPKTFQFTITYNGGDGKRCVAIIYTAVMGHV